MNLPKINKKVTDFFVGEEGSISKDKLIKTGIVIGTIAISSGIVAAVHTNDNCATPATDPANHNNDLHSNSISLTKNTNQVAGTHCNGKTHGSHSSSGSGSGSGSGWY